MTPGHLAANRSTVEVLLAHGADLNKSDSEGRTPLFIACATVNEVAMPVTPKVHYQYNSVDSTVVRSTQHFTFALCASV
jgi:Ankyrin repeats (many copies)